MMTDTRAAADMTKGVSLIGRHGLKADPTWAHVAYSIGGRDYLATVTGFYRAEVTGAWMLRVRHFNGEPLADVALSFVKLLNRN